ncbi:9299_t:CDS:1, partial [Funneliformis caledonium]
MPPFSKAKRAAKQCARKKGGEFTLRTDKEILEEMPHELEGSGGNSEGGLLNKPKDGNEKELLNKPGGEA